MRTLFIAIALLMIFASFASAKQIYGSNFDNETIGKVPAGWELGFKGAGNAKIIADPLNPNNKIFAHSDLAKDKARHDVGGNIWTVGDAKMQDYIVEYDAYFPEDFYMGALFRFISENEFYLLDRRSAGELGNFDFWKRGGGNWTKIVTAKFDAQPKIWYRFRIAIKGDTFDGYAKAKGDNTQFAKMKPFISGKDATYKEGKFALYGLIYVDNVVIGESEGDLSIIAVEPGGKATTTWGKLKN